MDDEAALEIFLFGTTVAMACFMSHVIIEHQHPNLAMVFEHLTIGIMAVTAIVFYVVTW